MKTQALAPLTPAERRQAALELRIRAAHAQTVQVHPVHTNNGDDDKYEDRRASFTKGLPHDHKTGLVNQAAYEALLTALRSGVPEQYERVPLPGSTTRKLTNPQAGLAFDLVGNDPQALTLPPAPPFDSNEIAAEIVENYWMALLRDVPFESYGSDSGAKEAATELSGFGFDFKGPKKAVEDGSLRVTTQSLFRGVLPGDTIGPYISQFLLLPVPFGAQGYEQRMRTLRSRADFVTSWDEYVNVQCGANRTLTQNDFDGDVFIRNGRDLSRWVHVDVLFQAYFNAMLILLHGQEHQSPVNGGIKSSQISYSDPGNPYNSSATQLAFGTFGDPFIAASICEVATRALKTVWFQKWHVHRRLRPEAFAARIHSNLERGTSFNISEKALKAKVLDHIQAHNGHQSFKSPSYLLPLAFPEGSPTHPAYGAGHATVAGACVTLLKAYFDEDIKLADLNVIPKVAAPDGKSLQPYAGKDVKDMTIGGELNKLASNVALGRNMAGVHWRSDGTESLFLGEEVAIAFLRDQRLTFNERFAGWNLTTFSGRKVVI